MGELKTLYASLCTRRISIVHCEINQTEVTVTLTSLAYWNLNSRGTGKRQDVFVHCPE